MNRSDHPPGQHPTPQGRHQRELDRLALRHVRPLVVIGQRSVLLRAEEGPSFQVPLQWLERWGGTFGTASSASANARRGGKGEFERGPAGKTDRGGKPAWLLYFSCPECFRRCAVLYSARGQYKYACHKCERPVWQYNGSGGQLAERTRLNHRNAAARIRRYYLQQQTGIKPPKMTWRRYEALCRLIEAHEILAQEVQLDQLQRSLARLGQNADPPEEQPPSKWALAILKMDAWATRQTSWHRRGKPRDTPGEGTRKKLAKIELTAVKDAAKI